MALTLAPAFLFIGATVRPATGADRPALERLLLAYLSDADVDLLPCPENVDTLLSLFDQYVAGQVAGMVLVATEGYGKSLVGFSMAGELPLGFITKHGRAAMGWGTYVAPVARRRGVSSQLRKELDARLRALGFDTVIGGYSPSNKAAERSLRDTGFEVYQVLGAKRLKEKES